MANIGFNGNYGTSLPVGVSDLGTLVWDNVLFPSLLYDHLPLRLDAATVSVNMAKEIVRTKISTVKGEFKEYTATGDYDILITALITPPPLSFSKLLSVGDQHPTRQLRAFMSVFDFNDVVQIRSKYLNNVMDINKVVIKSASMSPDTPDTFKLTINCISDFDFDFGDFG